MTYEEGGFEDDLSPEAEAAHSAFVRQIAAEHGFPLSDWKPVTPAPDASGTVERMSQNLADQTFDSYQDAAASTAIYPRVYTEEQVRDMLYRVLSASMTDRLTDAVTDSLLDEFETPLNRLIYPVLGLVGEAGEIANKMKKGVRSSEYQIDWDGIADENGDVLWYVAAIASDLRMKLGSIARNNIDKLFSRKARGVIAGDGDKR